MTESLFTINRATPDILVVTTPERRIVGFISGGLIREAFEEFDGELHAIILESFQRMGLGSRLTREWAALATRARLARCSHSCFRRELGMRIL